LKGSGPGSARRAAAEGASLAWRRGTTGRQVKDACTAFSVESLSRASPAVMMSGPGGGSFG
jgi:hypothetical protein